MGPQFICTDWPQNIKMFQYRPFGTYNLKFAFCSYRALIDHVACTARLCIKLFFFHLSIFIRNRKQVCSLSTLFFSCLSKLQHTITIDSSCLIQTSLRMSILIKKTLKLLSCSLRPYNTNLNLNSNLSIENCELVCISHDSSVLTGHKI
jgi:hypothetical protein